MIEPSLTESHRAALAGPLRTLQIIVFALATGVTTFGVVAVVHNLGKPQVLAGKVGPHNFVFLGLGMAVLIIGLILPPILVKRMQVSPALAKQLAGQDPNLTRLFAIQQRIQASTIIGCALFEGGAFANLTAYLQKPELLHLALAGVLLLAVISRFTTRGSYQQRVEDELRRMADEEALSPDGTAALASGKRTES